jgi:hypothetical protein
MKQEHDKEIDLLLKRHAQNEKTRLKATFFVEEGNGEKAFGFEASAHLDADEMNAYAENALPANARARYAAHLVDCNDCRTLITQLALSENPIIAETKDEAVAVATAKQSWGEWFSSLLTFPTLRIVGPVAAVFCVAAISVVVWQNRSESPYSSADQNVSNDNQRLRMTRPEEVAQSGPGAVAPSSPMQTPTPDRMNTNTSAQKQPVQKKETGSREDSPVAGSVERDRETADETTLSRKAPATKSADVDDDPKPTPSKVEAKTGVANQRIEEQQVTQSGGGPRRNEMRDRNVQRQATTPANESVASAPAPNKSVETEKAEGERLGEAKKDDSTTDKTTLKAKRAGPVTRTVSGKQFLREGGIWVDVTYNSSTATTNISRGSENYRSLIADEPGLKAIAEQLSGEVIVVWKGRAYRFR